MAKLLIDLQTQHHHFFGGVTLRGTGRKPHKNKYQKRFEQAQSISPNGQKGRQVFLNITPDEASGQLIERSNRRFLPELQAAPLPTVRWAPEKANKTHNRTHARG